MDTRLIRTPHYYKQFALSLGKESPYIFQLIQPAHMDTPLIGKRFMAPSVSKITGFDCTGFTTTATTTTTTTIFIVPKAEYYSYLQVVKLIN